MAAASGDARLNAGHCQSRLPTVLFLVEWSRHLSCLWHVAFRLAIVWPRMNSENGLRPLAYNSHVNLMCTCKTGLVCLKHTRLAHLWLVCPGREKIIVCRGTCVRLRGVTEKASSPPPQAIHTVSAAGGWLQSRRHGGHVSAPSTGDFWPRWCVCLPLEAGAGVLLMTGQLVGCGWVMLPGRTSAQ